MQRPATSRFATPRARSARSGISRRAVVAREAQPRPGRLLAQLHRPRRERHRVGERGAALDVRGLDAVLAERATALAHPDARRQCRDPARSEAVDPSPQEGLEGERELAAVHLERGEAARIERVVGESVRGLEVDRHEGLAGAVGRTQRGAARARRQLAAAHRRRDPVRHLQPPVVGERARPRAPRAGTRTRAAAGGRRPRSSEPAPSSANTAASPDASTTTAGSICSRTPRQKISTLSTRAPPRAAIAAVWKRTLETGRVARDLVRDAREGRRAMRQHVDASHADRVPRRRRSRAGGPATSVAKPGLASHRARLLAQQVEPAHGVHQRRGRHAAERARATRRAASGRRCARR